MTRAKPNTPNAETRAAMAEAEAIIWAKQLPPGSKEAREHGCTCPVLDNEDMRGVTNAKGESMFVVSSRCPLHRHIFERLHSE